MLFFITQIIGWSAFGATTIVLARQAARRDPRWGNEQYWPKLFVLLGLLSAIGLTALAAHFFQWDAHPGGDFLAIALWPSINVVLLFFFSALSRIVRK